jgi:hypothetical protein
MVQHPTLAFKAPEIESMNSRKRPDQTWESFIEERIQEAYEDGEFDNLPGFGKPLPGLDGPDDENWWLKEKLKRENLSALPPGLAIRVEVHKTLERIWALASENAVRAAVEELNEKIRRANLNVLWGPPSTTMPLSADDVVQQWRKRKAPNGS